MLKQFFASFMPLTSYQKKKFNEMKMLVSIYTQTNWFKTSQWKYLIWFLIEQMEKG